MKKSIEVLMILLVLSIVFPLVLYAQGPVEPVWVEKVVVTDMVQHKFVIDQWYSAGWHWTGVMTRTPAGQVIIVMGAWVLRAINSVPIVVPVPYWQFDQRQPDV